MSSLEGSLSEKVSFCSKTGECDAFVAIVFDAIETSGSRLHWSAPQGTCYRVCPFFSFSFPLRSIPSVNSRLPPLTSTRWPTQTLRQSTAIFWLRLNHLLLQKQWALNSTAPRQIRSVRRCCTDTLLRFQLRCRYWIFASMSRPLLFDETHSKDILEARSYLNVGVLISVTSCEQLNAAFVDRPRRCTAHEL